MFIDLLAPVPLHPRCPLASVLLHPWRQDRHGRLAHRLPRIGCRHGVQAGDDDDEDTIMSEVREGG
jgi:hypothetical protein